MHTIKFIKFTYTHWLLPNVDRMLIEIWTLMALLLMSQMEWGHDIGNWGKNGPFYKMRESGWFTFYCFVESTTCKLSTWILSWIDFHENCERSGWHQILFLLPYISLSLEVTNVCNSWIFLGCYDTNLFACWLFPLSILKFLWTAKSISICPSAFQLLKLCYIFL